MPYPTAKFSARFLFRGVLELAGDQCLDLREAQALGLNIFTRIGLRHSGELDRLGSCLRWMSAHDLSWFDSEI